jgi:hypothetical protein
MRMEEYTTAFPRRVNVDQYAPIIEAALKATKGTDGHPRVVVEDYPTYQLATRAANAIRTHSRLHKADLRVSCPENGKSIFVYKSKPIAARKRKNEPATNEPISKQPDRVALADTGAVEQVPVLVGQ